MHDQISMYACAGHGIYNSLMKHRPDSHNHGLSDIHHGNVYHALSLQNNQPNEDHNIWISFTLNTDGALVYQSTGCSMWPVLLMINELPFNARYIIIILAWVCN